MIIKKADYELTAVYESQYPKILLPEIAFIGRSNVGKSSLINAMCNRKDMARVGQTPGKTRQINFYNINEKLRLVDLPGYGYAKVSKTEQATWTNIVETYLNKRNSLKMIIQLIDIRHNPEKTDETMINWIINKQIPFIIVAVKSDKLTKSKIKPSVSNIIKKLELEFDFPVIPVSAQKKTGIKEIWKEIDRRVVIK